MRSKFFVISTAVIALVLAASAVLVNLNQDIGSEPPDGRILGVTIFQGILQAKKAAANGTVALTLVISFGNNRQSTITVNTTAATKFTDRKGSAITAANLASGHALEITGTKQRNGFLAVLVKNQSYVRNKSKVVVTKNTAQGDGSVAAPTGFVSAEQVKVASFVIAAPESDDALVSSIALRDAAGVCGVRYVDNIVLRDSSSQQLGVVAATATCPVYTFNFKPEIFIKAGARYAVDVLADLALATPSPLSLFTVERVNAASNVTGNDMSASNVNLSLQNDYIVLRGALVVQTDPDSPTAANYLLGASDQVIAKFRLSAGPNEAINVKQLTASFLTAAAGDGDAIKNIRLFDVTDPNIEKQLGSAVAVLSDTVPGASSTLPSYKHATFYPDSLSIPAGTAKVVAVKVDIASYEGNFSATGQTITPVVLSTIDSASSLVALGAVSGDTIIPAVVNAGIPAEGQVIGKILISNLANAGLYMAQIKYFNVELISTFATVSGARYLNIYKDNISTTALGQAVWNATPEVSQIVNISDSAITKNVDIAAGASKTFYITLDTTDAAVGSSLSIRLPQGGIHWSDGLVDDISAMGNDLPLIYKTINY